MPNPASSHRVLKSREEVLRLLHRVPKLRAALEEANLQLSAQGRIRATPKMGCPFQGSAPCPKKLDFPKVVPSLPLSRTAPAVSTSRKASSTRKVSTNF